jgi:hypothetical protein
VVAVFRIPGLQSGDPALYLTGNDEGFYDVAFCQQPLKTDCHSDRHYLRVFPPLRGRARNGCGEKLTFINTASLIFTAMNDLGKFMAVLF